LPNFLQIGIKALWIEIMGWDFFDLRFGLSKRKTPFFYGVDFDQYGNAVFQGFLST